MCPCAPLSCKSQLGFNRSSALQCKRATGSQGPTLQTSVFKVESSFVCWTYLPNHLSELPNPHTVHLHEHVDFHK